MSYHGPIERLIISSFLFDILGYSSGGKRKKIPAAVRSWRHGNKLHCGDDIILLCKQG